MFKSYLYKNIIALQGKLSSTILSLFWNVMMLFFYWICSFYGNFEIIWVNSRIVSPLKQYTLWFSFFIIYKNNELFVSFWHVVFEHKFRFLVKKWNYIERGRNFVHTTSLITTCSFIQYITQKVKYIREYTIS